MKLESGESAPKRIQRRRTKGWRMPPNTVNCTRPGKWSNPFRVSEYGARLAVFNFRQRLKNQLLIGALDLAEIRGKDLACFCRLDAEWCHVDVLLEIANEKS